MLDKIRRTRTVIVKALALHPCSTPLLYALALRPCSTPLLYALALRPCSTPLLYALALHPCSTPLLYVLALDVEDKGGLRRTQLATVPFPIAKLHYRTCLGLGQAFFPPPSRVHVLQITKDMSSTLQEPCPQYSSKKTVVCPPQYIKGHIRLKIFFRSVIEKEKEE